MMEEEDSGEETPQEETPQEGQAGQSKETGSKQSSVKQFAKKLNASMAAGVLIALVLGLVIGQVALPAIGVGLIAMPSTVPPIGAEVDIAALEGKVETYLNENVLEPQGVEGEVLSIEPYDSDFYLVSVDVLRDGTSLGAQDLYLTRSGNAISGSVLFLEEELDVPGASQQEPAEAPKASVPKIELFVMSYCPYGLQAQKAMLPVMKLLGGKADIDVKFVDYIMHDLQEIEENTTQYCIQETQREKYFDYLNCFVLSGDSADCLSQAAVNQELLDACAEQADEQFGIMDSYEDKSSWLSGAFPQYNVHKELNEKYGVGGSPALVINGVQVSASRSPEAVKQIVCDAFEQQPEECSQTLSTETASPGIGAGTGSNSEGYC